MNHIGSLVGRVFLLASGSATSDWQGEADYDLLDEYISYEEGDITSFTKPNGFVYLVYFCMSSRLELFSIEDGFIIYDGLYFNTPLGDAPVIGFDETAVTDLSINIEEDCKLYIYDGVRHGDSVVKSGHDRMSDSVLLCLKEGTYFINKVETTLSINEENVLLKGIRVTRI